MSGLKGSRGDPGSGVLIGDVGPDGDIGKIEGCIRVLEIHFIPSVNFLKRKDLRVCVVMMDSEVSLVCEGFLELTVEKVCFNLMHPPFAKYCIKQEKYLQR